jgi:hypothetical protein
MQCARKIVLFICLALAVLLAAGCIFYFHPVSDGRTRQERQRIADALFTMLHSSLTNEVEIKADNPAVPEVIRAMHPMDIELMGGDAVIICPGKPAEYHLASRPDEPKTWILYVAGPGYFGHQEILRMKKD